MSVGVGPSVSGEERAGVDPETGPGHAPVQNFKDSDYFKCNLVFQPLVSLQFPGLDCME